jgi:glycosyltransferase involved in cell wall biosynthesis/predicted O-methyltransferase YrrM
MTRAQPLVSCIMPTADRREFVPLAIDYFLRQDYPRRELIVVDDGADSVEDLMPDDGRVRYFRLGARRSVGEKRNYACEQARGEVIAHWDDDDWYAPRRLSYQAAALLDGRADACGVNVLYFYDPARGAAWKYTYPAHQRAWLAGNSLCYTRSFWESNRFEHINVGEDARFVWRNRAARILVLDDATFMVPIIHPRNVSPKRTGGAYWRPHPVGEIRTLLGDDWLNYNPDEAPAASYARGVTAVWADDDGGPQAPPVRNVYACLVHESPECVLDLVRNLRYHDPDSPILLYNGGGNPGLLAQRLHFERHGAVVLPNPRPMRWGWLHDFALDSMRFALENTPFDTLTVVDSDQLCVNPGYPAYMGRHLANEDGVGLLGNSPGPQPPHTRVGPAAAAYKEFDLWRPFLRRFEGGEEKFVHWTFWPSTVFTSDAARDLLRLFDTDAQLRDIMGRSKIWATEEVIFPTLTALLGYRVAANPCSYDLVKYRTRYSPRQIADAIARPDVFWVHPVPRQYGDPLRKQIRTRFDHYVRAAAPAPRAAAAPAPRLLVRAEIIAQMRGVEGWLEDAEADLLIAAAEHALTAGEEPHAVVEVGSYCGRATTVLGRVALAVRPESKVYSVDPHDGRVGALDQGVASHGPTLEKFRRNMQRAGLADSVEVIQRRAADVLWSRPVGLLLIDGLHDYFSVSQDFHSFEPWVVPGGLVAFHDYAAYFPGVQAFVDELLASGRYRKLNCVGTLMLLQRCAGAPPQEEEDADRRPVPLLQVTGAALSR